MWVSLHPGIVRLSLGSLGSGDWAGQEGKFGIPLQQPAGPAPICVSGCSAQSSA